MSLLSAVCTVALQLGDPCGPAASATAIEEPRQAFATLALADDELARIYGTGIPAVGLDQAAAAGSVRSVDVAFDAVRTSDQTRDLFDNWTVEVAAPLIAQAVADARR